MRIIDRDFDFYDAMSCEHIRAGRNCANGDEPRHAALRDAARDIRNALAHYRRLLDGNA